MGRRIKYLQLSQLLYGLWREFTAGSSEEEEEEEEEGGGGGGARVMVMVMVMVFEVDVDGQRRVGLWDGADAEEYPGGEFG